MVYFHMVLESVRCKLLSIRHRFIFCFPTFSYSSIPCSGRSLFVILKRVKESSRCYGADQRVRQRSTPRPYNAHAQGRNNSVHVRPKRRGRLGVLLTYQTQPQHSRAPSQGGAPPTKCQHCTEFACGAAVPTSTARVWEIKAPASPVRHTSEASSDDKMSNIFILQVAS